jgi:hypothetical protein
MTLQSIDRPEKLPGTDAQRVFQIRLVAGRSRIVQVCLFQASRRTLVVGSSGLCQWRIHARGVRPRHLKLVWNGKRLRVDEVCSASEVFVDNHPIGCRLELLARAMLTFGDAALLLAPPTADQPTCTSLGTRPLLGAPPPQGASGRPDCRAS